MSPAVHGGGPRWKSFEYNTLLSAEPFREERIMDANRYFTAMHNAMSSRLPGAQLLAAVRLQDLCGNDAYLEVRRMPGEHCATVCYSTMGRRGLNFQLFRKGWMLCHNESGQLTGQFPAKAESLLEDTDFHASLPSVNVPFSSSVPLNTWMRSCSGGKSGTCASSFSTSRMLVIFRGILFTAQNFSLS